MNSAMMRGEAPTFLFSVSLLAIITRSLRISLPPFQFLSCPLLPSALSQRYTRPGKTLTFTTDTNQHRTSPNETNPILLDSNPRSHHMSRSSGHDWLLYITWVLHRRWSSLAAAVVLSYRSSNLVPGLGIVSWVSSLLPAIILPLPHPPVQPRGNQNLIQEKKLLKASWTRPPESTTAREKSHPLFVLVVVVVCIVSFGVSSPALCRQPVSAVNVVYLRRLIPDKIYLLKR